MQSSGVCELLALDSQHKGTNAPSLNSPEVDEERMGLGHWLR